MNRKDKPKNKVITMRLTEDTYDSVMDMKPEGMTWETYMSWVLDINEAIKTKE